jgi:hypothetical protein
MRYPPLGSVHVLAEQSANEELVRLGMSFGCLPTNAGASNRTFFSNKAGEGDFLNTTIAPVPLCHLPFAPSRPSKAKYDHPNP